MKIKLQLSPDEFQTFQNIVFVMIERIPPDTLQYIVLIALLRKLYNRLYNRFPAGKKTNVVLNIYDVYALSVMIGLIRVDNYASYEQNFILMLKMEIDKFKTNLIR